MVFVDGIPRIKPKRLFHASPGASILRKEGHLYDPHVTVEFNKTAYNNGDVFLAQIKKEIIPAFGGRPSFFAFDATGFHKTDTVLNTLKTRNITPSMILGGWTSLVQPSDISINFPFKKLFRDEIAEYIDLEEVRGKSSWTVGDRRVMTTICVGRVGEKFFSKKRVIVHQSFCNVGLALPVDGSRDTELNINGFTAQDLKFGDWTQDYTGQEEYCVLREADDCSVIDFE